MATPIIMPRQGQSVESCIISHWNKKVGDQINVGDILFTYETDKATFDEEAKAAGTMLAILCQEGDDVPCLSNVCVIGSPGEDISEYTGGTKQAKPVSTPTAEQQAAKAVPSSPAHPVIMPRQGQSVESCIISHWNKKPGDKVVVGDILFTYETDKATFDEEAKVAGTLLAVFFQEGDDVPCLTNVCVIGQPGDGVAEFDPHETVDSKQAEPADRVQQAVPQPVLQQSAVDGESGHLAVSPRARQLAGKTGINPALLAGGTGPQGRIIERDIRDAIASGGTATYAAASYAKEEMQGTGLGGRVRVSDLEGASQSAKAAEAAPIPEKAAERAPENDYIDEKIPNIRKVISRSMHQSLSTMAQLTLNASFDATNVLAFRKQLKESRERLNLENITINDIILYAVSRTILGHKEVNANFIQDGTTMRYFQNAHLGIAVDTPRGLMVPTLRYANRKSLNEISAEAKKLAAAAQSGSVAPDLLTGGTFTITNLGTLGVESFTPVINPPQTAILGVNTLETRVKNDNGEMKLYQAMTLSLTFDHRALDGAPAARFLQELCRNLEQFSLLLAK